MSKNIEEDKRKKEIEKTKEKLYTEFKNNIIDTIDTLINNKIQEKDNNGKKYNKNKIAEELNITYQALLNYTTDRVPDLKQLVYIKKYFNVPFSTFFKDDIDSNSDNSTLNNSMLLGLDSTSIEILKELKLKSKNDNYENNYLNTTKLFLINALIQDEKLFSKLADYFSISLGRNLSDKKYEGIQFYKPFKNDESAYSMTKYAIMTEFIMYIDNLVKGENVPRNIKNNALNYAYKYSGSMQKVIDDYNNNK